MQFIGIEIAPADREAVMPDLDSAETLAEASVSQDRMARQKHLVGTLHPAGFI